MSRRFSPAPKCEKCQKSVYFNEEVKDGERIYHKQCFRCAHCNKVIEVTSYSQYGGVVYCKPHFIALFRARGKYDDLGNPADSQQKLPKSPTEERPQLYSPGAASPTMMGMKGKKDLSSALRRRDPAQVEAMIQQRGLHILFANSGDGVTPIETAFANSNQECGRMMIKYIREALETKNFEWEREFAEADAAVDNDARKAFEEPKEWKKTESSEISDSLSKLKKVDRAAFEQKSESQEPNEIEQRKQALRNSKEQTAENASSPTAPVHAVHNAHEEIQHEQAIHQAQQEEQPIVQQEWQPVQQEEQPIQQQWQQEEQPIQQEWQANQQEEQANQQEEQPIQQEWQANQHEEQPIQQEWQQEEQPIQQEWQANQEEEQPIQQAEAQNEQQIYPQQHQQVDTAAYYQSEQQEHQQEYQQTENDEVAY